MAGCRSLLKMVLGISRWCTSRLQDSRVSTKGIVCSQQTGVSFGVLKQVQCSAAVTRIRARRAPSDRYSRRACCTGSSRQAGRQSEAESGGRHLPLSSEDRSAEEGGQRQCQTSREHSSADEQLPPEAVTRGERECVGAGGVVDPRAMGSCVDKMCRRGPRGPAHGPRAWRRRVAAMECARSCWCLGCSPRAAK